MTHSIDSKIADLLLRIEPSGDPMSVEQARQKARDDNALALQGMNPALLPASEVDEVFETDAGPIPVRILRPTTSGTHLTVVYFHGGGWVVGDIDTHLGHARRICAQANAVVVSVGYRLAPENPFPAAYEDAVAATEWAAQRLSELGGEDVLVVAGDGVGGQLAASVAIARRNAGLPLAAQLLLYPVIDAAGRYTDPEINGHYMSRRTRERGYGLTLSGMVGFAHAYVGEADAADWRVSPIREKDLTGVAPAVIHTATLDVLRTEGNFYGDALRNAGVAVISREWPILNHSYFALSGVPAVADSAGAQAAEELLALLGRDH